MYEKDQLNSTQRKCKQSTKSLVVHAPAGFVVSTLKPMFGASPDSFTVCACCGTGVLEVKCPYCVQNTSLEDVAVKSSFYLSKLSNGKFKIKP